MKPQILILISARAPTAVAQDRRGGEEEEESPRRRTKNEVGGTPRT